MWPSASLSSSPTIAPGRVNTSNYLAPPAPACRRQPLFRLLGSAAQPLGPMQRRGASTLSVSRRGESYVKRCRRGRQVATRWKGPLRGPPKPCATGWRLLWKLSARCGGPQCTWDWCPPGRMDAGSAVAGCASGISCRLVAGAIQARTVHVGHCCDECCPLAAGPPEESEVLAKCVFGRETDLGRLQMRNKDM